MRRNRSKEDVSSSQSHHELPQEGVCPSVPTTKAVPEDTEDSVALPGSWVNQPFAKGDLGGASQCPPQVLSFTPILTEDIKYVTKTVLGIASYMLQMCPVTP